MTENIGHKLLFDSDCPFCRSLVNRWRGTLVRRGFELVPLQAEWVRRRLDLPEEELLREMRVLTSDNFVLDGAAALVHVWGKIWWAWPLWLAAQMPGAKWLLDRAYLWVAERRMCLSGACSLHVYPAPKRGLGIVGWLPLLTLPATAIAFRPEFPEKWMFMWVLAFTIFMSCKGLTWVRAWSEGGMGGFGRALGYLFLWPGMDAKPFMGDDEPASRPVVREWLAAGFKLLLGASRDGAKTAQYRPAAIVHDKYKKQDASENEHATRCRGGLFLLLATCANVQVVVLVSRTSQGSVFLQRNGGERPKQVLVDAETVGCTAGGASCRIHFSDARPSNPSRADRYQGGNQCQQFQHNRVTGPDVDIVLLGQGDCHGCRFIPFSFRNRAVPVVILDPPKVTH